MDTNHPTELRNLLVAYRLCARAEGKSPRTIETVENTVQYLRRFLESQKLPTDAARITTAHLRAYMVDLRALQSFFRWLEEEGLCLLNPFDRFTIPRAPLKVVPSFSQDQLEGLFASIDTRTPAGYRDFTILLILLDTMIRSSELRNLQLGDVDFDRRQLRIRGKGNKERFVPIGARVQKGLWKYLHAYRPQPAIPRYEHVFLTREGRPLTKERLLAIVKRRGIRAGIHGVRLSPHTFRHTAADMFLRNGGDVFSLQRIMGHSQLEVLRGYVNLALSDVAEVHRRNSPADNLDFSSAGGRQRRKRKKSCRN